MERRRHRTRASFAVGDPLRGLSALAVAVGHVVGLAAISWNLARPVDARVDVRGMFGAFSDLLNAGGTVGVSVFFVLSGYLLSRPFVRALVLDETRPSLRHYTRNRLLRIVPAYWVALTVLVVLVGAKGASAGRMAHTYLFDADWPSHPLATWFGQAWTLDVEMRFYVLLAVVGTGLVLLARAVGPRLSPGARIAAVLLIAVAVAAWSCNAYAELRFPFVLLFDENVGRFMGGVALAAVEAAALSRLRSRATGVAAVGLFVLGAALLVAGGVAERDASLPLGWATSPLLVVSAGAVVAGPLLWQWSGRPAWRGLDNRPLRWAGSRSYSIYLVHFGVYWGLMEATDLGGYHQRLLLLALVGFPLALLVAELLHRYVERPFLRRRAPSQVVPTERRPLAAPPA